MCIITALYKKLFLLRYDKDEAIPYVSYTDYSGLICEKGSFRNSNDVHIEYFIYYYDGYKRDKMLLFCPGLGPGHTAYLAEIERLCRGGYRVLTLDYTGCGTSGGDRLPSINAPTRDVVELIEYLHPSERIIPIGHSMGGYTVLNLCNMTPSFDRAVILSGFVDIFSEMMGFLKSRLLANRIRLYERKWDKHLGALDNRAYLAATTDKLLWFHSTDDPMVNYEYNAGQVIQLHNPNVHVVTVEGKKHNPQYTQGALDRMNTWIGEYNRLVKSKHLATLEARKAYFADKPVAMMTEQDPTVYDEILRFIEE